MPTFKMRLDLLAVEMGLFTNRQIASTAIMSGAVLVNGQKCIKPGTAVSTDSNVETIPSWKIPPYASRGGVKLEHALKEFQTRVANRICLDIGASTGGFTDCLLQHGAAKIYAVDVGYGQIDWKLRQDQRVKVLERINARHLQPNILYEHGDPKADLAVVDVSFISLTKILKPCKDCLNSSAIEMICLIKPQFEAGKKNVKRGGIVTSPSIHLEVLQSITRYAAEIDLVPTAVTFSPLKGPSGNIEFFLRLQPEGKSIDDIDLEATVTLAHSTLD
jgi:23S rRNA (cytidine1920-2'-O)/16S rRNA (cytidine1409-2'-O)-methyltransferase